ncbi:MAG: hypothetical protein ACE5WD_01515 [Candidatus Aminicenantia bacterium]
MARQRRVPASQFWLQAGDIPNPTIETVKKIADALRVGIDDLMKY